MDKEQMIIGGVGRKGRSWVGGRHAQSNVARKKLFELGEMAFQLQSVSLAMDSIFAQISLNRTSARMC